MNRINSLIVGAAATAALLLLLTAAGAVPGWLGVLLTGCLIPIVGLVIRFRGPEQPLPPLPPPHVEYVPTQAPPPPTVQIQGAPLPSADPDYRFLLSCMACWRIRGNGTTPPIENPEELARLTVIARASQLTTAEQPGNYDLIRHKLDGTLTVPLPDRSGTIEIWAHSVWLTLPDGDLQRQHELAAIRKDEQVWEHKRNHERNLRAYLLKEALPDTGSAVAWWLSKNPEQVRETVGLIGTLAQLSAAANNREVDPVFQPLVNGTARADGNGTPSRPPDVGELFAGLNGNTAAGDTADATARTAHSFVDLLFAVDAEAERTRFADQLAKLVKSYGHGDLAERIRTDFDAPDFDFPDFDIPDDGDGADPTPNDEAVTGPVTGRHGMPDDPPDGQANGAENADHQEVHWPS